MRDRKAGDRGYQRERVRAEGRRRGGGGGRECGKKSRRGGGLSADRRGWVSLTASVSQVAAPKGSTEDEKCLDRLHSLAPLGSPLCCTLPPSPGLCVKQPAV